MWGERYATSGALFGCAVNVSEPPPPHGCKSYSDTMVDVKRQADEVSLPYKWWLMDSWWYPKGSLNGVKTWDALPSTFPGSDGRGGDRAIGELASATGWGIVAHIRFFAADTSYALSNGGKYEFVVERGRYSAHPTEGGLALPLDKRFWRELLTNKTGAFKLLVGVEMDWMCVPPPCPLSPSRRLHAAPSMAHRSKCPRPATSGGSTGRHKPVGGSLAWLGLDGLDFGLTLA